MSCVRYVVLAVCLHGCVSVCHWMGSRMSHTSGGRMSRLHTMHHHPRLHQSEPHRTPMPVVRVMSAGLPGGGPLHELDHARAQRLDRPQRVGPPPAYTHHPCTQQLSRARAAWHAAGRGACGHSLSPQPWQQPAREVHGGEGHEQRRHHHADVQGAPQAPRDATQAPQEAATVSQCQVLRGGHRAGAERAGSPSCTPPVGLVLCTPPARRASTQFCSRTKIRGDGRDLRGLLLTDGSQHSAHDRVEVGATQTDDGPHCPDRPAASCCRWDRLGAGVQPAETGHVLS